MKRYKQKQSTKTLTSLGGNKTKVTGEERVLTVWGRLLNLIGR